jgi:hypothetical protein
MCKKEKRTNKKKENSVLSVKTPLNLLCVLDRQETYNYMKCARKHMGDGIKIEFCRAYRVFLLSTDIPLPATSCPTSNDSPTAPGSPCCRPPGLGMTTHTLCQPSSARRQWLDAP